MGGELSISIDAVASTPTSAQFCSVVGLREEVAVARGIAVEAQQLSSVPVPMPRPSEHRQVRVTLALAPVGDSHAGIEVITAVDDQIVSTQQPPAVPARTGSAPP